jgi:hypothetical protein
VVLAIIAVHYEKRAGIVERAWWAVSAVLCKGHPPPGVQELACLDRGQGLGRQAIVRAAVSLGMSF